MVYQEAQHLGEKLVAAFRPYVELRLEERGWPAVTDAVGGAERWLRESLDELLAMPFHLQDRGPLEVFQEAMAGPTAALLEEGVAPVRRDSGAESALPGDVLDLAPSSSAEIGDAVWKAHLAWGARKAEAMRPTALVLSANLLDVERIDAEIRQAGYRMERLGDLPDSVRAAAGFVDLEHPDADAAIRLLAGCAIRVVAFGPHVDDIAMSRARALGAFDAVPRSRFFGAIGGWLPRFV